MKLKMSFRKTLFFIIIILDFDFARTQELSGKISAIYNYYLAEAEE